VRLGVKSHRGDKFLAKHLFLLWMTKGKEVVEDGVCEPLNEPFEHRICNGETNELLLPTCA